MKVLVEETCFVDALWASYLQKAMRRLSEGNKALFDIICAAMKKCFERECRKEVFMAEFQMKKKQKNEKWASFAKDLKILAEKPI